MLDANYKPLEGFPTSAINSFKELLPVVPKVEEETTSFFDQPVEEPPKKKPRMEEVAQKDWFSATVTHVGEDTPVQDFQALIQTKPGSTVDNTTMAFEGRCLCVVVFVY